MPREIPCPPGLPFVGNLLDVANPKYKDEPLRAFERLADEYGPIFKLMLGGKERIVIANYELFEELCDETRFFKAPGAALEGLSKGAGAGEKPPYAIRYTMSLFLDQH
jgi:cytochrome P450/NADPH-cytochrome P450 reductase